MELTLHPLAKTCRVTGTAFAEGDRVVSYLVREAGGEFGRHDMLASAEADYAKPEVVFCRWVVEFKARRTEENSGRALKLTAENLFVTLADPMMESSDANTPMLQFLALMLERKKVLKPRGLNADRTRNVYEHAKTKQLFEVPVGELDEAFFVNIQGQLDLLVGSPKSAKKDEAAAAAQNAAAEKTAPAVAEPLPGAAEAAPTENVSAPPTSAEVPPAI